MEIFSESVIPDEKGGVQQTVSSNSTAVGIPHKAQLALYRKGLSAIGKLNYQQLIKTLPQDKTWDFGEAIDNGDCFYDAVAQSLDARAKNSPHTLKSLRVMCSDCLYQLNAQSPEANWVKEAIEKDKGIDDYQTHLTSVQFTTEEMTSLKQERIFTGYAIWGKPHIEGKILAQQLKINLHIIEFHEAGSGMEAVEPMHILVTKDKVTQVEKESIHYQDEQIIHLAVCRNHFVPILPSQYLKQQQSNPESRKLELTQFSKHSHKKSDNPLNLKEDSEKSLQKTDLELVGSNEEEASGRIIVNESLVSYLELINELIKEYVNAIRSDAFFGSFRQYLEDKSQQGQKVSCKNLDFKDQDLSGKYSENPEQSQETNFGGIELSGLMKARCFLANFEDASFIPGTKVNKAKKLNPANVYQTKNIEKVNASGDPEVSAVIRGAIKLSKLTNKIHGLDGLVTDYKNLYDKALYKRKLVKNEVGTEKQLTEAINYFKEVLNQESTKLEANEITPMLPAEKTDQSARAQIYDCLSRVNEYRTHHIYNNRILAEIFGFILRQARSINDKELNDNVLNEIIEFIVGKCLSKKLIGNDIKNEFRKLFDMISMRLFELRKKEIPDQRELRNYISENFCGLYNNLVKEIFKFVKKLLEPIPDQNCKYSIICMGSLATQLTTPYSDVRFTIIANKTAGVEVYFKRFSELVELIIICYGETPICDAKLILTSLPCSILLGFSTNNGVPISVQHEIIGTVNTPIALLSKLKALLTTDHNDESIKLCNSLLMTEELFGNDSGEDGQHAQYRELLFTFLKSNEGAKLLIYLIEYINSKYDELLRDFTLFQRTMEKASESNIKLLLTYLIESMKLIVLFLYRDHQANTLPSNFWECIERLCLHEAGKALYKAWVKLLTDLLKLRLEYRQEDKSELSKSSYNTILQEKALGVYVLLIEIKRKIEKIVNSDLSKEVKNMSVTQQEFEEIKLIKENTMPKSTDQSTTEQNQLVTFYQGATSLVPNPEQLQSIVEKPEEYKLSKSGACYALIKGKSENTSDGVMLQTLQKMKRIKDFVNEKDNLFGHSASHWAAVFNYPTSGLFLNNKIARTTLNKSNLTPNQTAAMVGNKEFLIAQLDDLPQWTEVEISFTSLKGENVKVKLNELHLSMFRDFNLVDEIIRVFKKKHIPINTTIQGIGNLLHLIVYVADVERSKGLPPVNAMNMLNFILIQAFQGKTIAGLLTEDNNHERFTPLALAAAHGRVELVHRLVGYVMMHVEEMAGLEQIEQAFFMAAQHGQDDVMEMLHDYYGFKPMAGENYKRTLRIIDKKTESGDDSYSSTSALLDNIVNKTKVNTFIPPDAGSQPFGTLVLSGGGGKGLGFPYVIYALKAYCDQRSQKTITESQKASLKFDRIERVIGTSAGAIFALGLAVGYPIEKMIALLEYDFGKFLESDHLNTIVAEINKKNPSIGDVIDELFQQLQVKVDNLKSTAETVLSDKSKVKKGLEIIKHAKGIYHELSALQAKIKELDKSFKGFSTGKVAYEFIKDLLKEVDIKDPTLLTFGELAAMIDQNPDKLKHLHVVVTNLTQGRFEVLSTENKIYKDYLVLPAVRCSMSYPIVFETYHLEMKIHGEIVLLPDEYIDGGALRNYAIDECDFKKYTNNDYTGDPDYPELNKKTIGIRFKAERSVKTPSAQHTHPLVTKIMAFVNLYMEAESLIAEHVDKEYHRSIVLDTESVTTFTFKKLATEEKAMLAKNSIAAIEDYSGKKLENINVTSLLQGSFFNEVESSKKISQALREETGKFLSAVASDVKSTLLISIQSLIQEAKKEQQENEIALIFTNEAKARQLCINLEKFYTDKNDERKLERRSAGSMENPGVTFALTLSTKEYNDLMGANAFESLTTTPAVYQHP